MNAIDPRTLYEWCRVPFDELERHPGRKVPFRLVRDSAAMGELMARELVEDIEAANRRGEELRAVIPCGPSSWYQPFTTLVNERAVSLGGFVVYHMDECLDWQGRELPRAHPYSFRGFMERHFYQPVRPDLAVPEKNRVWLTPSTMEEVRGRIKAHPPAVTLGGWGQDGHIAYNQARRHPYSSITLEDLASSTIRIQENNWDTIIALAQRTFGAAWQFVPPQSITLGMRECLSAGRVRLFSDTGAWKQTALRVALFSEPTAEYPMTLLQNHPDALVTATVDTARHPVSVHPEWDLGFSGVVVGLVDPSSARRRFRGLIGTGGIGHGSFFLLEGNETLGREESRPGRFLDRRDYCKLHIICHYVKVLLGDAIDVTPIGRVGGDADGERLCREMREVGLDLRYVKTMRGLPTLFSFCFVYPDGSGGNLTTRDSASGGVDEASIVEAEPLMAAAGAGGLALAVPEVSLGARRALLERATRFGLFRAASFTRAEMDEVRETGILREVDLCAVNLEEAAAAAGMPAGTGAQAEPAGVARQAAERIAVDYPRLFLSIAGGSAGSWSWDGHALVFDPAVRVDVKGTSGAGDAHFAGILAGLALDLPLPEAQQLGTIVAAASVTSAHTIHPALSAGLLGSVLGARADTSQRVRRLLDTHMAGF